MTRWQNILKDFNTFLKVHPSPGTHRIISDRTREIYTRNVQDFFLWFLQTNGIDDTDFDPAAVTGEDIHEYLGYLRTVKQFKVATIRLRFAALTAFFQWAVRQGLAVSDPTQGVPLPSQQLLAPRGLNSQERRALLRVFNALPQDTPTRRLKAVRDRAIVYTMMYVGLRVSEVVNLRLPDLTLRQRSGEIVVRAGKGDKDRIAAVPLEARRALRAWLEVRPKTPEVRPKTPHDFVFTRVRSPYGPMTTRAVQLMISNLAHLAHIEDLTPHVLRHTAAYLWRQSGAEVEVAAQLGHRHPSTTARYGRPSVSDLKRVANRLNGWRDEDEE